MSNQKLIPILVGFAVVVCALTIGFFALLTDAPWDRREVKFAFDTSRTAFRDDRLAIELANNAMQQLGKNPQEYRLAEFSEGRLCGRSTNYPDRAHLLYIATNRAEGWSVRLEHRNQKTHVSIAPTK